MNDDPLEDAEADEGGGENLDTEVEGVALERCCSSLGMLSGENVGLFFAPRCFLEDECVNRTAWEDTLLSPSSGGEGVIMMPILSRVVSE